MSLFSKLFGGKKQEVEPEDYQGYRIYAAPMAEGGVFRIAARIEKEVAGEMRSHQLIRADTLNSKAEAEAASIAKAKAMIDQLGEALFD